MEISLVEYQAVEKKIFLIRGHKVMLDTHLAELYCVELRSLIQAVMRNLNRFPSDFMFQLSEEEFDSLRSQFVILKKGGRGQHRKYKPYAFTQNGVAMLSSALRSPKAVQINIQIMRAFTKFKEMLTSNEGLRRKINSLERRFDKKFTIIFHAIQSLMDGPRRRFKIKGFISPKPRRR